MVKRYGREVGTKIGTVTREKNGKIITSNVYKDSKGRKSYVFAKSERSSDVKKQKAAIDKIKNKKSISKSEYKELKNKGFLKETEKGTILTREASKVGVTKVEQNRTQTTQVIGFTGNNLRDYNGKYRVQTTTTGRYSGDAPKSEVKELSRSEFIKQYPNQYQEIQRSGSKQSVSGTLLNKQTIGIGAFGEKLKTTTRKSSLTSPSVSYDGDVYKIQTENKISRRLNDKQNLDVEFDPNTQKELVAGLRSIKNTKPSKIGTGYITTSDFKRAKTKTGRFLQDFGMGSRAVFDHGAGRDITSQIYSGSGANALGTIFTAGASVFAAAAAGPTLGVTGTGVSLVFAGAETPKVAFAGFKAYKGKEYQKLSRDSTLKGAYSYGISESIKPEKNLNDYKNKLITSKSYLDKSIFFTGSKLKKGSIQEKAFYGGVRGIDQFSKNLLLIRGDESKFLSGAEKFKGTKLTEKEKSFLKSKRMVMGVSEPVGFTLAGAGTELAGRQLIPKVLSKFGNIGRKLTYGTVFTTSAAVIAPLGVAEGVSVTVNSATARGQKLTNKNLIIAGAVGGVSAGLIGGVIGAKQFATKGLTRKASSGIELFSNIADPFESIGDTSADIISKIGGIKAPKGRLTGVSKTARGFKQSKILSKGKYRGLTFVPTNTKSKNKVGVKTKVPISSDLLNFNVGLNIPSTLTTATTTSTMIKSSPYVKNTVLSNILSNTTTKASVTSAVPSNVYTAVPVMTNVPVSTNVPVTVRTNVFTPQLSIPFIPVGAGVGRRRPKKGKRTKKGYETKLISSVKKFITTGKVKIKKTKLYK